MLDHETYSYEASKEGIKLLAENNIPLIMVSSKTLCEMKIFHKELKLSSPLVFEGGGGIAFYEDNVLKETLKE